MDAIRIRSGGPLRGSVQVSGAKNAALPILCATLLSDGASRLRNVPALRDIDTTAALLRFLGRGVRVAAPEVEVEAGSSVRPEAPYELVKQMRASVLVLGPLVARFGHAKVSLPGGCAIGARPIDQHLKGLEAMGCRIRLERGYVHVEGPGNRGRLRAGEVYFDIPTVTGTENLMMAAALAKGRTTLVNCAREPEIEELARVLNKMGAEVDGAGTDVIHVRGSERGELAPFDHAIIPDRIEAGTYMVAAALAEGGEVTLRGAELGDMEPLVVKMRAAGVEIASEGQDVLVRRTRPLRPVNVTTAPHPGFPTDMQAQFLVLMCFARGRERHQRDHLREPVHARPPSFSRMQARASRFAATRRWCRESTSSTVPASWPPICARARRSSSRGLRRGQDEPRCAASITSTAATSASRRKLPRARREDRIERVKGAEA